jgi:seryl-tRNA synthetase
MLSIDFIRANPDLVKQAAQNKNREVEIDRILSLDEVRRDLIKQAQVLREERNSLSKQTFSEEVKSRGIEIKTQLKDIEGKLDETETEMNKLISFVPNVPDASVPVGKDENDNVEIRTWGNPMTATFPIKSHIELGQDLDIVDFERGSKVSGFRGYFLKNEGALLHMAVMMYVFQKLIAKGYTPIVAPAITKGFTFFGTAQFPWGQPEVYTLNDDDAYLAGTAEVPVTSYFAGETLTEKDLPKRFVAFSPCFRREAGSHGKDTKGLYRVHEFWKIEQVIVGKASMEEAYILHEELQQNSEQILQELELPYRVLLMCTGDMGEPQVKKYDTETWMPSREAYGETMSNSIMGDFQARRLNLRYKTKEGKTEFCYTYNNTALASPRILIAIMENYQQADGSILVPKVLQPYVGKEIISRAQ